MLSKHLYPYLLLNNFMKKQVAALLLLLLAVSSFTAATRAVGYRSCADCTFTYAVPRDPMIAGSSAFLYNDYAPVAATSMPYYPPTPAYAPPSVAATPVPWFVAVAPLPPVQPIISTPAPFYVSTFYTPAVTPIEPVTFSARFSRNNYFWQRWHYNGE